MDIQNIRKKLGEAKKDDVVGIRRAALASGREMGLHVAEVTKRLAAHVHLKGDEIYHVLEGNGTMHVGAARFGDGAPDGVDWEEPYPVGPGDVFNIPEGCAHSLSNSGGMPLVIAFVCPHTHLTTDRHVVENPPEAK